MCCCKLSAESKSHQKESIFLCFPLAQPQKQHISLVSQDVLCPPVCELGDSNQHRSALLGYLCLRWDCLLLTSAMSSVKNLHASISSPTCSGPSTLQSTFQHILTLSKFLISTQCSQTARLLRIPR